MKFLLTSDIDLVCKGVKKEWKMRAIAAAFHADEVWEEHWLPVLFCVMEPLHLPVIY